MRERDNDLSIDTNALQERIVIFDNTKIILEKIKS